MKDTFVYEPNNNYTYKGFIDETFRFIEDFQLMRPDIWKRFVLQFRENADSDSGWKGEFWGKMMRGACMTYAYTKNEELYEILENTVKDMMESADKNGRISTYPYETELGGGESGGWGGWDMWCRKYVMLGMEYFLEICKDEKFKNKVIDSMCKQADYILSKVGGKPGNKEKICITSTSSFWRGLNSSSFLEPIVRLYNITNNKNYFDFATEIVEIGFTDVENLISLAYKNELYPYQYHVTKAYEMMSCFEGLMEYYKITGNEMYKTAIINFADKILESDFTVIGSCGCTNELFDHSTVRQANTNNDVVAQETCVTVTLMKFMYRVHLLTGDPQYVDAVERAFYNAYLGAVNTEKVVDPSVIREHSDWIAEPLPFDSYSPLTAGTRGVRIGGLQPMSDKHYYGCCASIGSAGIGVIPHIHLLKSNAGIVLNLYINGTAETMTPSGQKIVLKTDTMYPSDGKVSIKVGIEKSEKFEIKLRNPDWNKKTSLEVNGENTDITDGYISIVKEWKNGDTIVFTLDMTTKAVYPIPYGSQVLMNKVMFQFNYVLPTFDREDPLAKYHVALRRGPIMLAAENRLGYSVDDAVDFKINDDSVNVKKTEREIPYKSIVKFDVELENGDFITLTDYASAGKLWTEESKTAVWIRTNKAHA